jgi:hypothetical protein
MALRTLRRWGLKVLRVDCALADGEGTWFLESRNAFQKTKYKWGDAKYYVSSLKNIRKGFDLALADLGGVKSSQNLEILQNCDRLVVCCNSEDEFAEWVEFACSANSQIEGLALYTDPSFDRVLLRENKIPQENWKKIEELCKKLLKN